MATSGRLAGNVGEASFNWKLYSSSSLSFLGFEPPLAYLHHGWSFVSFKAVWPCLRNVSFLRFLGGGTKSISSRRWFRVDHVSNSGFHFLVPLDFHRLSGFLVLVLVSLFGFAPSRTLFSTFTG